MAIDYLAGVEETPQAISDAALAVIAELAAKQAEIQAWIARTEDKLKEAGEHLRRISEVALPNAMAEIGMQEFTLQDGTKISVKQEYYASIPKDGQELAFSWLREHDFGGLIKNVISVQFGKGEDERALEAAHLLAGQGFMPEQKQTVHPQTLKAFVKEQVEKGAEIPLDILGAHCVNKAKVVLPKS